MRDIKSEIGKKLRRLREEKGLTREVLCNDESELTVRQLVRIEKGESLPSLKKLEYIANMLGIPVSNIVDHDKAVLPRRYLELKFLVTHFMTYGDEERIRLKESYFDEIYESYFEDLPEEEQVAIEAVDAALNVFSTEKAEYGENLIEEYFGQLMTKKEFSQNDLLIIKLFLFKCLARAKDKRDAMILVDKMIATKDSSDKTSLYLITRNLIAMTSILYQDEDYEQLGPYIDELDKLVQETQYFQQQPGIDMMKGTYAFYVEKDIEKAKVFYHQAMVCAHSFGEFDLENKIKKEMEKHIKIKWRLYMKLAEALILRADLQKRIDQLRVRLNNNAKVQENDEPSEKPEELLNELDSNINQLKILIKQINKTNSVTVSNGQTLADLIAERDTLTLKSNILRGFLNIAGQKVNLYSTTEIKIMSTVDVPALQKELDLLSKKIRETDTELQQANWLTELIEN